MGAVVFSDMATKSDKERKKIAHKLGIKAGHQKDGGYIGKNALGSSHSNFHYGK